MLKDTDTNKHVTVSFNGMKRLLLLHIILSFFYTTDICDEYGNNKHINN